ncbi:lysozyme inhibitor [Aeromonas hydrophila]|uniref:Lysozyme inhibitor n=1 Tax=Aeromonas hydrophila TaxID=644 RepID=A0A926FLF2_AERHY|nr:lysozyme inhibitor [Aeromonas hydrophila]
MTRLSRIGALPAAGRRHAGVCRRHLYLGSAAVGGPRPLGQGDPGHQNLPKWVRSGNGTSSPLEAVAGTPIRAARSANHDCASHYMQLLVDAKAKRVWGVLIDLPDSDAARETPSKIRPLHLARPAGQGMQAALMKQVEADPNWQ